METQSKILNVSDMGNHNEKANKYLQRTRALCTMIMPLAPEKDRFMSFKDAPPPGEVINEISW